MTKLEELQRLWKNANAIRELFQKTNRISYEFSSGNSFLACEHIKIALSSQKRIIVKSECKIALLLDRDIFKKHLLLYLNKNKKEIMLSITRQIEEEVLTLKEEALTELKDKIKILEELNKL
jgi:hypothetical protein